MIPTSTTNWDFLAAQDIISKCWWHIQVSPISRTFLKFNISNKSSHQRVNRVWQSQPQKVAKAYAATFSLVTIMIWSVGSITSNPAIMAAADSVLPAPNTPLMGQSVLPSNSDCTSAVTAAMKCPSLFSTSGWRASLRASSSSLSVCALASCKTNMSNLCAARNNFIRSPVAIGLKGSTTLSPHPKHNRSGGMPVKTAKSSALLASPTQPKVWLIKGEIHPVIVPIKRFATEGFCNCRRKPGKFSDIRGNPLPQPIF